MAVYTQWLHGTAVQIESLIEKSTVQRAGWGTDIRQPAGTSNWFHFPLPTLLQTNDWLNNLKTLYLHLHAESGVKVTSIHVWSGRGRTGPTGETNAEARVYAADGLALTGLQSWSYSFEPAVAIQGGVALCVGAAWTTANARLSFTGAGITVEEIEQAG